MMSLTDDLKSYGTYMKFDLHVHSKFSRDCFLEPRHIVRVARRRGICGIAITDHDVFRPFLHRLGKDVIVIAGCEVRTEVGDITGLFLTENIKNNVSFCVVDEIRDQGGVVVLPHPFKYHRLSYELLKEVDVVEGFNARTSSKNNKRAVELSLKYGKPMIAGSDAHFLFEVGRGVTLVRHASSEDEVRKAMLNSNVNILGVQFDDKYLSVLCTMNKAVEAMKNPRVIPDLTFKAVCRALHK